jgi:hypothetical protein
MKIVEWSPPWGGKSRFAWRAGRAYGLSESDRPGHEAYYESDAEEEPDTPARYNGLPWVLVCQGEMAITKFRRVTSGES